MKFSSLREYFQKLHNILYVIILAPVLSFGYVYLEAGYGAQDMPAPDPGDVLSYLLLLGLASLLAVATATFSRKLKVIRSIESITDRLKAYARATIIRFVLTAAAAFLGVGGLLFTANPVHAGLFVFLMILASFWWPSPGKLCRDLRLGGEEREWVMRKGDVKG